MAANNYILPFYDSLSKQAHRKDYAFGSVWPLVCQNRRLPCFQFIKTVELTNQITYLHLVRMDGTMDADILTDALAHGLSLQSFAPILTPSYDLVINTGLQLLDTLTPEGQYYLVMGYVDGGPTKTWYSEVFSIQHDVTRYIQLKFWHDVPFRLQQYHISYASPFYSFCFIDGVICKPVYVEEETAVNKDGIKQPTRQISKKTFRFTCFGPEFFTDAMRLVWMHNYVQIIFEGETYNVDDISFDAEWGDRAHLAKVECEFHTDTTTVRVTGRLKPEGDTGDYDNTDYEDSFLIT